MYSKLFRTSFFVVILTFIVSCTAEDTTASQESSESLPIVLNYEYSPVELETMTLINNYRVSIGLNALEKINHISYKSEEHDNY
ncbi:MAG TPA: CAP domain-containing protein, partial [Flavobacterium sp.]|nr:CAP domain-containing protein [Flavobacterium sp.]